MRVRVCLQKQDLRDLVSALILQHLALFAHTHTHTLTQSVLAVIVTVLMLLMEI